MRSQDGETVWSWRLRELPWYEPVQKTLNPTMPIRIRPQPGPTAGPVAPQPDTCCSLTDLRGKALLWLAVPQRGSFFPRQGFLIASGSFVPRVDWAPTTVRVALTPRGRALLSSHRTISAILAIRETRNTGALIAGTRRLVAVRD